MDTYAPTNLVYVSYRLWNEETFQYDDYSGPLIGPPDAARHLFDRPPLIILTSIRHL